MERKKLPKGLRKHIRREKARIRREIFDLEKQKEEIKKLYKGLKRDANYKFFHDAAREGSPENHSRGRTTGESATGKHRGSQ